MAIYGASAIEHFLRNKKTKKSFFLFSITTLLVIGAYQTQELQKDPEILKDSVSAAEELSIKRLGSWLKDFIEKEDVVDIYIPGEKSIDKIYRRLWGHLPGNINYYAIIGTMESYRLDTTQPLDMATYTIVPFKKNTKGLFIAYDRYDKIGSRLNNVDYRLLRTEQSLSLYIYLMEYGNDK